MDKRPQETFGTNIRMLRAQRNLSQLELAKELNVRQSTISMIENGCNFPEMSLAIRISKYFGVKLDNLLIEYQIA